MKSKICFVLLLTLFGLQKVQSQTNKKMIKTLIVDGQNNHEQWPKITYMMKQYLEETGKFSVDVKRTYFTWNGADLIQKYKIKSSSNLPKSL